MLEMDSSYHPINRVREENEELKGEIEKLKGEIKKEKKAQEEEKGYQKVMTNVIMGAMRQALGSVGDTTPANTTPANAKSANAKSANAKSANAKSELRAAAVWKNDDFYAAVEAAVDEERKKISKEMRKDYVERIQKAMKDLSEVSKKAMRALSTGSKNETKSEFAQTPLTNLFLPLRMNATDRFRLGDMSTRKY